MNGIRATGHVGGRLFTPARTTVHTPRASAHGGHQLSCSGFAASPERFTGVGTSLGRVRLTGLGCGKSLWDSPGRDPGVGGATSTTSGSTSMADAGPPGSMVVATLPVCVKGVKVSISGGPAVVRPPAAWGGVCAALCGESDMTEERLRGACLARKVRSGVVTVKCHRVTEASSCQAHTHTQGSPPSDTCRLLPLGRFCASET